MAASTSASRAADSSSDSSPARRPRAGLRLTALAAALAGVALLAGDAAPARAQAGGSDPAGGAGGADDPGRPGQASTALDPALYAGLDWRMVGPSRGGRVTAVAGHRSHPYTFYMGSTGGGVWKTENYGQTWQNVSDGSDFTTASIGAVQVADSDPDVVYVGTGSDGIRSNVITGRGVYRSTDAGESWTFLGLRTTGQIGAVEVHPEDPDRVYVAALGHPFGKNPERGVYRSTDGGGTWEQVLFVSDSVGAVDLELHPTNPELVYASLWRGERKPWTIISGCRAPCGDGIWKSTDGGDTWEQVFSGEGLPDGLIGKTDLAVSPDAPDRVYALVEARPEAEGLYRSDDAGATWELVSTYWRLMERPFYYTNVDADPTDADVVYVNNEAFVRSTDGGRSWERLSTPHGDNHDMWINPDDPDIWIQSNDGGANVTLDGGETWSTQSNQPTAELYQVDVDDRFPYWLYAGQQDNSTIGVPALPPAEPAPSGATSWWKALSGCETGPAVPQPGSDPLVVYGNCKGRFGRFTMRTGQEQHFWVGGQYFYGSHPDSMIYRFQRTVPIEISPHDPDVVYHGSQYVHRTLDDGRTWETVSPDLTARPAEQQVFSGTPITRDITGEENFSTLYVIEESPLVEGLLWAGSNDGVLHVTRDGGETWTDVTPPGLPPLGRVNAVSPSHRDPGTAYVAAYRYLLDDWEPYVFKTTDYGESWTRLTDGTNGIPADYPVRVVREDPERPGLLYAGTEFGIFVSFDDGEGWQSLQLDLPVTPVTDIEVVGEDLAISTMGRGFWILDGLGVLRQLTPEVASADAHLFRPEDTYRMRYSTPGGFFGEPEPHEPQYPPPGAMIHYWLADAPAGPVTLEIVGPDGDVIRTFTSTEEGEEAGEGQGMRAPFTRPAEPGLEAGAGTHRFLWNLRHPGPYEPEGYDPWAYGSTDAGPLAAPGEYTVRLVVDGETHERPLVVKPDPRVEADGVSVTDMLEQERHNLAVRDAISEARGAAVALERAREDLAEAEEAGRVGADRAAGLRSRIDGLHGELVTADGGRSYPVPRFIHQLEYLYGMTLRADQEPGRDAVERRETLRAELDDVLADVEEVTAAVEEATGG